MQKKVSGNGQKVLRGGVSFFCSCRFYPYRAQFFARGCRWPRNICSRRADTLGMKTIIPHTPIDLPAPLRRRMSQIRLSRGTAAAHAFAMAALSHLRTDANAAHMRRHVGAPGTLALRALIYHSIVAAPVTYFVAAAFGPATFVAALPILLVYILCRAIAAYLDGGRHD